MPPSISHVVAATCALRSDTLADGTTGECDHPTASTRPLTLFAEQSAQHLTSLVRRIAKRVAAQRRINLAGEWSWQLRLQIIGHDLHGLARLICRDTRPLRDLIHQLIHCQFLSYVCHAF